MDNDKSTLKKTSTYNVAVSLANNGKLINKGQLIPKGTRLLISVVGIEQGKETLHTYPFTMKMPLQKNSSLSLASLLNQSIGYKVIKMKVELPDYEESDMQDNCVSDGTNSCE